MSKYAELPDGTRLEFPDETSPEVMQAVVKRQLGIKDEPEEQSRSLAERTLRGLALGGRYLVETPGLAVAGLADLGSKAINTVIDMQQRGHGAPESGYRLPENRAQTIYEGFSQMGFPEAESDLERDAERVSRAVVSAGFGPAVGARMAASPSAVTSNVGRVLAEQPGIQGASAVTGAGSGALAERAGAGPGGQFVAEVAGSMIAPATVAGARAIGATGRGVAGVADAYTDAGQRRIVGGVLEDAAISPQKAGRNIDQSIQRPGITEPTTGQASRDPGLLTLERATRAMDRSGRFAQRMSDSNARLHRVLDVIGGDDIQTAKAARDATTGAQRDAAFAAASPKPVKPLVDSIDSILASPEGTRRVVRTALTEIKKDIERITDADGNIDPRRLYEIRKDINAAMEGKLSGDRSEFKLAKSQLIQVKKSIDDMIEQSAPGFKQYLADYARLSREIDQRGIIQDIQRRSTMAASDPSTGRDILSQAKFKRMLNAEIENGVLDADQIKVMQAVADELDSGQAINAATVRPPGSDTAKNLTVAHILGRAIGGNSDSKLMQNLARPLRWITVLPEEQIQGLLAEAMLDPKLARELLTEARPRQVAQLSASLRSRFGAGVTGGALGAAAQPRETQQ